MPKRSQKYKRTAGGDHEELKKRDFWWIKMFSILLQEWEGWNRFCKRYSRNHGTGALTWLNMLRPKGKTLHCFCDNDLWQMGKKSVWNTNSTAGAVLVCYAAVLLGRHATLLVGRKSWVTKQRTAALETGLVVECLRKYIAEGDFMAQLATRRCWFRFSWKPLISLKLSSFTTASQNGGWVPGVSRGFHNSATRPRAPHRRTGTGTRRTEKYQWQKNHSRGGGGGGGWKKPRGMDNAAGGKISTPLNHTRT